MTACPRKSATARNRSFCFLAYKYIQTKINRTMEREKKYLDNSTKTKLIITLKLTFEHKIFVYLYLINKNI